MPDDPPERGGSQPESVFDERFTMSFSPGHARAGSVNHGLSCRHAARSGAAPFHVFAKVKIYGVAGIVESFRFAARLDGDAFG
jgi:hypothetical protein